MSNISLHIFVNLFNHSKFCLTQSLWHKAGYVMAIFQPQQEFQRSCQFYRLIMLLFSTSLAKKMFRATLVHAILKAAARFRVRLASLFMKLLTLLLVPSQRQILCLALLHCHFSTRLLAFYSTSLSQFMESIHQFEARHKTIL